MCELRREHPRWGPRQIAHVLERSGAVTPVPSRMTSIGSWSVMGCWNRACGAGSGRVTDVCSGMRLCSCGRWTSSAG